MRYLGIDFGRKKIGLALGDDETRIAAPAEVLRVDGNEVQTLVALVQEEGVEALVVGVPLKVGGFHSPDQLKFTRAFIERLKSHLSLPIFEVDESFTSRESQRIQEETGTKAEEDALAAMLILQAYLDSKRD